MSGLSWQNEMESLGHTLAHRKRERGRELQRDIQDADCDKGLVGQKNPILPGESSSHLWIFYTYQTLQLDRIFLKTKQSFKCNLPLVNRMWWIFPVNLFCFSPVIHDAQSKDGSDHFSLKKTQNRFSVATSTTTFFFLIKSRFWNEMMSLPNMSYLHPCDLQGVINHLSCWRPTLTKNRNSSNLNPSIPFKSGFLTQIPTILNDVIFYVMLALGGWLSATDNQKFSLKSVKLTELAILFPGFSWR